MALTTVAAIKTHLGISASTEDTPLAQWLAQADALIKRYIGQNIEQATYVDFYAGTGSKMLALRQRPVQSITSIYLDNSAYYGEASGAFGSSTLLTAGTDYALVRDNPNAGSATEKSLSGMVVRINGVWDAASEQIVALLTQGVTAGIGNIKVTYVAGYATVPADIALACMEMVAILRAGAVTGGPLASEHYEFYDYTLASAGTDGGSALGSVKQLLSRYREWTF